ncbi:MAG TPA: 3'(2'),5'-bisphosphate nucleotidase [Candidatus Baltobacteraceae bacterium]|nr:3'(2'),5'-bisphosphate nucleotidase [Candidatus Baltobacteraceae bacterium]
MPGLSPVSCWGGDAYMRVPESDRFSHAPEVRGSLASLCRGGAVSEETLRVGMDAVHRACRICQVVRASLNEGGVAAKQGKEPVTIADFASQAAIVFALQDAFPAARIMAEETAEKLRTPEGARLRDEVVRHVRGLRPNAGAAQILNAIDSGQDVGGAHGRFWTLDPIDGTKGFLRGDQYVVALALIDDGEVLMGILGCPSLPFRQGERDAGGSLFVAVRGGGAHAYALDGTAHVPVQSSEVNLPQRATLCESVEAAHVSHGDAARVSAMIGLRRPSLRMDSQAKYAAVSRGDADIYLRLPSSPGKLERVWDHAAGTIILQESGGEVTDGRGERLDFSAGRRLARNVGVVATNGRLHPKVIAATREVLGFV